MKRTLLSFSGGIDSTYIAWKILTETDDELTCLFLHVPDREGMLFQGDTFLYEQSLILVEELKKIRDFKFIMKQCRKDEITDELNCFYTFFINFAAPYLNNNIFDRIVTGHSWEQAGQKILKNYDRSPVSIAGERLFNKLVTRGELWNPLATHDYVQNYSKAHAITQLPKEILEKSFSCSFPFKDSKNNLKPCNICYKCLWNIHINNMLESGKTPEEIDIYRIQTAYEYGGGELMAPLKYWIYLETGKKPPLHMFKHPDFKSKQEVIDYFLSTSRESIKLRKNVGVWEGLVDD